MNSAATINVLLVEDNPGDARLIEELLSEGHAGNASVSHAKSLAAAMEKLAAEPFDLVLLDMSMPDSQWLGSFAEIRSRAPDVPVLVLTGISDETLAVRSIREGAQDYLVKGDISPIELGRAIRFAVERGRITRERIASPTGFAASAFSSENGGVVIADAEGKIVLANAGAAEILDLPEGNRNGLKLASVLESAKPSVSLSSLADSTATSSTFSISLPGNKLQVECQLTRIFDAPGKLSGLVLVLRKR